MRHIHHQLILGLMLASALHAQKKAAIVYSAATSRVRRVVIPDDDAELGSIKLSNGEAVMLVDRAAMDLPAKAQGAVTAKTGQTPAHDRYVAVPAGKGIQPVAAVLIADPSCGDAVPGSDLMQHDSADTTWQYDRDKQVFVAPVVAAAVVSDPQGK